MAKIFLSADKGSEVYSEAINECIKYTEFNGGLFIRTNKTFAEFTSMLHKFKGDFFIVDLEDNDRTARVRTPELKEYLL